MRTAEDEPRVSSDARAPLSNNSSKFNAKKKKVTTTQLICARNNSTNNFRKLNSQTDQIKRC